LHLLCCAVAVSQVFESRPALESGSAVCVWQKAPAGVKSRVPFARRKQHVGYSRGLEGPGTLHCTAFARECQSILSWAISYDGYFCDTCALAASINMRILSFIAPVTGLCAAW